MQTTRPSLPTKRITFIVALSFLLYHFGPVLEHGSRWTNRYTGYFSAVFFAIPQSIAWALFIVPWMVGTYFLFLWRGWLRAWFIPALLPSVIISSISLWHMVISPETPATRLLRLAEGVWPPSATEVHYFFSGGGFADYSDTYSLRCEPGDTDKIIQSMRLHKVDDGGEQPSEYFPGWLLPGAPDFHDWKDAVRYSRDDDDRGWHYELLTDSSRRMVYIHVLCI